MNSRLYADLLISVLLIAANAALAGLIALIFLGPTLAGLVAGMVAFFALVGPGVNTRRAVQRFGGQRLPEDHWLARLVSVLAQRAQLAQNPVVYVLPNRMPNAMAMGDSHEGAVAVTAGALETLPDDELAGVLAHEVAHLQHSDTRMLAISAMTARVTGILSQIMLVIVVIALPMVFVGAMHIPPWLIVTVLGAPWLATALQMALSRRREFAADRRAGELTGQPQALARALQRLEFRTQRSLPPWLKPYVGQEHPWLRSHPPTAQRLAALAVVPENPHLPPLPGRSTWSAHPVRRGVTTLLRILRGW
jgi:heat shock protein HtpX